MKSRMLLYFAFYFHDVTSGFSYLYIIAHWTNLNLNHNVIFLFYKSRFICAYYC